MKSKLTLLQLNDVMKWQRIVWATNINKQIYSQKILDDARQLFTFTT